MKQEIINDFKSFKTDLGNKVANSKGVEFINDL